jgi:hypothetical protein
VTPEQTSLPQPIQPPLPTSSSHDEPYTWGRRPSTYVSFRDIVRLTILRSKLEAVRRERLQAPSPATRSVEPAQSDCAP